VIAVVGAGPFGLSVAAHLPDARVYGEAMRTWRESMPPDMLLRSAWHETSLSAPEGGTIDDFAAATGTPRREPLPLQTFLAYADWFRERFVADHDPAGVAAVEPAGRGLRVTTAAGEESTARAVVIAVGVTPFAYAPQPFAEALGDGVELATAARDTRTLAGRRVAVIGAGQNALETAGVAARDGAAVELLARSPVRWFAAREPETPRGPLRRSLYRLAYPALGYGPPPLNRIVLHPDLFSSLPVEVRLRLNRRLLRSGGSPWLRSLVEGRVRITEGVTVERLERGDGLRLRLSDGGVREVDLVLLATGYRFDLAKLPFLDPQLAAGIRTERSWPVLDRFFRSTDPRILFVGYPAELRFGPVSRFVLGAPFSARRVARALRA
jgi:cation diffusion facilitator CzcD-associated flavoprotein CzcO